ncbi:glycosyltransferase [Caballeronia sp. LZ065]|uniref:glycosyltransferase family 4 protein n=1 Tax=Caballeronia sp. LZ065 TaxID=3038571 RepID=UPI00285998B4|nr:glycosyltransferase [Caballeronia sp. LZ065]MDR5781701.1 glycosyltransferase [Caballeronia sp. LZ065]
MASSSQQTARARALHKAAEERHSQADYPRQERPGEQVVRILHVITALDVGGAESMLQRLIESHDGSLQYRHAVCSLTQVGKIGERLRARGIDVHVLGMRGFLGIPRAMWRLRRLILTHRPEIVQTWMYHADLLGGLAARLASHRRIVWGIRTTDVRAGGSRSTLAVRKICAWLSSRVPLTIVCAADASRRVHVGAGYDASRMLVVPNGFDIANLVASDIQRSSFRKECGFGDGDVVIGTVGRFHPVKDLRNFVRSAAIVARSVPNARFLLVGRGLEPINPELMSWIDETGETSRFVLLGERLDVPICLSAMDVFCLSSRTEGFPNVVGEAMAMGVPCVVTDVGDAALLVAQTGIVVPSEDSASLADGLARFATLAPQARSDIGQLAKARIHAEYTMERARERFEELYQRLLLEGHSR